MNREDMAIKMIPRLCSSICFLVKVRRGRCTKLCINRRPRKLVVSIMEADRLDFLWLLLSNSCSSWNLSASAPAKEAKYLISAPSFYISKLPFGGLDRVSVTAGSTTVVAISIISPSVAMAAAAFSSSVPLRCWNFLRNRADLVILMMIKMFMIKMVA